MLFRLDEPFSVHLGPNCSITVPAGYVTNFGTIPRWAAWFVSPAQLRDAAIVHDWMCGEDFGESDAVAIQSGYSRWLADATLYELMLQLSFPWYKRFVVWTAVRLAAWWHGLE